MRFFKFLALSSNSGIFEKLTTEVEDQILQFLPVEIQMDMAQTCNSFRNKVREMYRGPVLTMIENLDLDHFKIESDEKLYKEMETFTKAMFSTIQGFYHLEYKHKDDRSFKDDFLATNENIQVYLEVLFPFLPKPINQDSRNFEYNFIAKDGDIKNFIQNVVLVFAQTNTSIRNLDLPNLTLLLLKLTDENVEINNRKFCRNILLQNTIKKPKKYGKILKYLVKNYGIKRNQLVQRLKNDLSIRTEDCENLVKYQFESERNINLVYFVQAFLVFTTSVTLLTLISLAFNLKMVETDFFTKTTDLVLPVLILLTMHYQYVVTQRFNDFYEIKNEKNKK